MVNIITSIGLVIVYFLDMNTVLCKLAIIHLYYHVYFIEVK